MAQVTITLDAIAFEREIGKAGMMEINLAKMPEASLTYIFNYGLKQVLADAHSAAKTGDEAKALSEKKLEALYEGTLRASSGRTSDPVLAEAKRLAKAAIEAGLKAKGKKLKDVEVKAVADAVAKLAPQYMDKAREIVAKAQEAAGAVDLGSLGL